MKKIIEDDGFLSQKLDGYQITDPRHPTIPGLTRSEIEAGGNVDIFNGEKFFTTPLPHPQRAPRGHKEGTKREPHPQRAPNWHPALSNRIPLCHSASDVTLIVQSIQAEENRISAK